MILFSIILVIKALGEATLSFPVLSQLPERVNSYREKFAPLSIFFLLRESLSREGIHHPGKKIGSHKS